VVQAYLTLAKRMSQKKEKYTYQNINSDTSLSGTSEKKSKQKVVKKM